MHEVLFYVSMLLSSSGEHDDDIAEEEKEEEEQRGKRVQRNVCFLLHHCPEIIPSRCVCVCVCVCVCFLLSR